MLWSILLFMFDYDYTLEESGVEIEEKSNKQVRLRKGGGENALSQIT